PFPARALGEIGVLLGVGVMYHGLGRDVPTVPVPGNARDVAGRDGVGEHLERRLGLVPVVIPVQDDGPDTAADEQWAQVAAAQRRAGRRLEAHPRIIRRLVVRLVLDGDRV